MSGKALLVHSRPAVRLAQTAVLLVGLAWATAATADPVTFFSLTNGFVHGHGTGGSDAIQYNGTQSNSGASYLGNPDLLETWSGGANLTSGALRLTSRTTWAAGFDSDYAQTVINTAFGDTISYTGEAHGIDTATAVLNLSGAWSQAQPGSSTISSNAFLQAIFLTPGAFVVGGNLAPASERIATQTWAVSNLSSFPSTYLLPISLADLPSGFRVVFVLSLAITGNNPDNDGLSWNVDLGHTLQVNLLAPDGVTFTSAGGLPTSSSAAVPEPATLVLFGTGLLLLTRRRKP